MAYFNNFPKIVYNGITSRNILLKASIISEVFNSKGNFYNYIIQDGYRPDMVANDVYKDPKYDWVVYFSNYVVDPYYEWPLSTDDLNKFLTKKYGKTVYEIMSTVSHYEYTGINSDTNQDIARKSWKMSIDTHSSLSVQDLAGWSPVYIYDYETRLNDAKRSIQLLSPSYLIQIEKELSKIF